MAIDTLSIVKVEWINNHTKLNHTNMTNGINNNLDAIVAKTNEIISAVNKSDAMEMSSYSAFSSSVTYAAGDVCYHPASGPDAKYYRRKTAGSGDWDPNQWDLIRGIVPVDSALDEDSTNPVQNKVVTAAINGLDGRLDTAEGDIDALEANVDKIFDDLAPEYNASSAYEVGDYCLHEGSLYKCAVKIASGEAWNAAHWEVANIGDDLKGKITFGSGWFDGTGGVEYSEVAGNLVSTKGLTVNDDPMSYGIVGGAQKSAVGDGNASLNKLVCVDVVRNQWFNSTRNYTHTGITANQSYSSDKRKATFTFTSDQSALLQIYNYTSVAQAPMPAGHLFLHFAKITSSINAKLQLRVYPTLNGVKYDLTANKPQFCAYIGTANTNTAEAREIGVIGQPSDQVYHSGDILIIEDMVLIDLTQRYGNNEVVNAIIGTGTSDEKVTSLLAFDPEILSNLEHDEGTLVPSKTAKLLPVGVNQWDEEWERGAIDYTTGNYVENNSRIISKNYISTLPNTTYYCKSPSDAVLVYAYDKNYVYIGGYADGMWVKNGISYVSNITFKTPPETAYLKIAGSTSYGATYNNDICINISDSNINGKYYPSKRNPVTLPNYEGHGILKVVDGKVVADGTELYPDGNSKKRYGIVDFSTKTFVAESDYYSLSLDVKPQGNGVCNKYAIVKTYAEFTSGDKVIYFGTNRIVLKDSSISQASQIVGTLSYELAAPQDITTPVFQSTFPVEQGGTLQFLDENDNPIAGLQGSEIFYQKNIKAFVEALGEATDWDPDAIMFKADEMTDGELLAVQNIITGN